jgi:hypothetical protein
LTFGSYKAGLDDGDLGVVGNDETRNATDRRTQRRRSISAGYAVIDKRSPNSAALTLKSYELVDHFDRSVVENEVELLTE